MNELIKVREVSLKYDVSARALKYYEDMGLLTSTRGDDYAYRQYDGEALKRLEQILILRKLNISVKDIKRIFNTAGSEVVLEVLGKKVTDIDEEVALLHELREIVLDFINEIERLNFADNSDIKRLYDKAKDIETHFKNVEYIGKPSGTVEQSDKIERLIEITDKLDKKIPDIFVIKVPKCRVVTSGVQTWDNWDILMSWAWQDGRTEKMFKPFIFDCLDFLLLRGDKAEYIMLPHDHVKPEDVKPFEMYDFEGGLYAMSVAIDDDDESYGKVQDKIFKWLDTTNFEVDDKRFTMVNMAFEDEEIREGLGYNQAPRFIPIKLKSSEAVHFPYELDLPLKDGDYTYWNPPMKYLKAASKMVVEFEGILSNGYMFIRQNPTPWQEHPNGSETIIEEAGRLIFDLKKSEGVKLGFAAWGEGESKKVKRIYLE